MKNNSGDIGSKGSGDDIALRTSNNVVGSGVGSKDSGRNIIIGDISSKSVVDDVGLENSSGKVASKSSDDSVIADGTRKKVDGGPKRCYDRERRERRRR